MSRCDSLGGGHLLLFAVVRVKPRTFEVLGLNYEVIFEVSLGGQIRQELEVLQKEGNGMRLLG
jgi:hypothetical protein